MRVELNVDVHHVARIEGHGNIVVRVQDGQVVEARWEIVETPRFFEVMLKGKHYSSAAILTARICGICSIGHALASLRATEDAFGIVPPPAALRYRLLAKHGETLQSHVLHLFLLAAPDFLDVPSVLPLLETSPDVVKLAASLRGLGNRLCDAVAGRTTHPVSLQVGGHGAPPDRERLRVLREELLQALPQLATAADIFRGFALPDFAPETEFVSLRGEHDYPWIGGRLMSSDGVERAEREYREMTNEHPVPNGTSKWCKLSRDAFAVGPLARVNNSFRFLHPEARKVAALLGLEPVSHNPFHSHAARLVECVHVVHDAVRLVDEALAAPTDEPLFVPVRPRAGQGVGAVEVPRGILYHHYKYDDEGRIVSANCVIPTTQNNAKIHLDIAGLARRCAGEPGMTDEKLARLCEMLVRAYDPCVSCSVH